MKYRVAPEVRGTLFATAAAVFGCVLVVCCFAILPLRAQNGTSELRRCTEGARRTEGARQTFSLPNTAGANVALEAARGNVVLVHFFATWCETCREELPALNRLAARANGEVKVLAIAVADADQRVRRFVENVPVVFPILLDRDRAVAKAWQVATLPTSFVLDADLRPSFVVETDCAWDSIDPSKLTSS